MTGMVNGWYGEWPVGWMANMLNSLYAEWLLG